MAQGDITYKYSKITSDDTTGVINYAEQKQIEDDNGMVDDFGKLHRPGFVAPRVKDADGVWQDNDVTDKPQFVKDLASGLWTQARKDAYEAANS